jgi:methionyl-tRNA formyltransferase
MLAPVPVGAPRRLAYLGTPEAAVRPLVALIDAGFDVGVVVTRPDVRRGRGGALLPSPVKVAAESSGIAVVHTVDEMFAHDVELGVVVAYGEIIRPHALARLPFVNLHFSLLPRWRGAAPVERAILEGDERTGVCLMRVEEGLDTGAVFARTELVIGEDETADELRSRLVDVGSDLLVRCLRDGLGEPAVQVGEPTVAKKLSTAEHRIDWTAGALAVHRLVRVGRAWTEFEGRRLKILSTSLVDAGDTDPIVPCPGLRVDRVQPEGRGPMSFVDWRRGLRTTSDAVLGG